MKSTLWTFGFSFALILPCVAGAAIFLLPFLEAGHISRWQVVGAIMSVAMLAALMLIAITQTIENRTTRDNERTNAKIRQRGVNHRFIK